MNWASKTASFSESDEFVVYHNNRRKWLQDLHCQVREKFLKLIVHKPYIIKKRFGNWRDQVVDWYNDWVINGLSKKTKHLYLHGKSGTGKTNFIQYLMSN